MAVALWPRAVYLVISMTMTTTFATAVAAEISLASDFCRRRAAADAKWHHCEDRWMPLSIYSDSVTHSIQLNVM